MAAICLCSFTLLAILSHRDGGPELEIYLALHGLIGITLLTYWIWLSHHQLEISLAIIIIFACVLRLIGLLGAPIFEDDYYRYLLDGCVFAQHGSPYGIAPEALFAKNDLNSQCNAVLSWVNNPDIPTIYGPALQYLFLLANYISPANLYILKIILILPDIGVIIVLSKMTAAKNLLLYAWNPLIIKEIAFTAHPDIVGIFFLLSAFYIFRQGKFFLASVLVALACGSKIFALLLVPYFIWRQKLSTILAIPAVILILYLPFILQGQSDLSVVNLFVQQWQFNSYVYSPLLNFLSDSSARILCAVIFIAWWCYYFFRFQRKQQPKTLPRFEWILGMFLLLSPVLNAWYVIWLLPFATMHRHIWPWVVSASISLSYAVGLNLADSSLGAYQVAPWAWVTQLILLATAISFDFYKSKVLNQN